MDALTTQGQMHEFLGLCRQVIGSLHTALYCAGVLVGFIIFPIYGVVLLRRRTRIHMENVLDEIAEGDPWLWAAGHGKATFRADRPLQWLQDLCQWQARYHGVKIFFGSPDLEAKCIQVTSALVDVFLSRSYEFRKMPAPRKEKLVELLRQLKKWSVDPELEKLLTLLTARADPLESIRNLSDKICTVKSWSDFLERLRLPSHLSPQEAVDHEPRSRELLTAALLLFARPDCPCADQCESLLHALRRRSAGPLQLTSIRVDQAIEADGALVASLRQLFDATASAAPPGSDAARLQEHAAWRRFVLAFRESPFEVLQAEPGDGFAALRAKHHRLSSACRARSGDQPAAVRQQKRLDLAWEVVMLLNRDRLLSQWFSVQSKRGVSDGEPARPD